MTGWGSHNDAMAKSRRAGAGRRLAARATFAAVLVGFLASTSWAIGVCRSCSTIGSLTDCYNTLVTTLSGGYC
jgi:hypothetical protein